MLQSLISSQDEADTDLARGLKRVEEQQAAFLSSFEVDGYALVKGIFSLDEVIALRKVCAELHESTGGKHGEIATYPALRRVLLDDRVIAIARAVLGRQASYFGDSTFYANSRFDRHLHNDARGDTEDPARSSFPIIRMGIYLQDHAQFSNGLKVRPGSHRSAFWTPRNALRLAGLGGKKLSIEAFRPRWFHNVPTEPGDLVFWSLRMHHSAHAIRLRGLPDFALPPRLEDVLPPRFARPMSKDRYAVFMSWGKDSPALDAYMKQLAYHPQYTPMLKRSSLATDEVRQAFGQKGVPLDERMYKLAQLG